MRKRIIKSFCLLVVLAFTSSLQAQCLNINGDMESYTSSPVSGNAWINNDLTNWSVSHGTPTIITSPDMEMWMWSYYGDGEGVYTNYSFTSGQTYQLSYDLWRDGTSNPSSLFRVELTNGLTPGTGSSFNPPPVPSQPLTTQPWVGTGSWVTITETFVAGAYNQIWFYPDLAGAPTPWQAACRIDNICITEVSTNPCEFEPRFDVFYDEECNVRFENTTSIPSGLTILETYWDFGDGTTGTGSTIDHFFEMGGVYNVCMTVWVINEDGECCKREFCMEIDAPHCEPCEWIRNAVIEIDGTNPFTFSVNGLPSGMYSILGYHWDFGDGTTGTGNPVNHTYASGGGYVVCLTIYYYNPETRECCNFRVCIDVEASDGGGGADDGDVRSPIIEEGVNYEESNIGLQPSMDNMVIAPNPNDGTFEIYTKDGEIINTITIYDPAGKVVYSNDSSQELARVSFALESMEPGMYIIVINENNDLNRQFSKLIIE